MDRLVLAALVAALLPGVAAALPPPSAIEIERLVKQLGADEFARRESASTALERFGAKALPALQRAANDTGDAEVQARARRLLATIPRPAVARANGRLHGSWRVVGLERLGRQVQHSAASVFTFGEDGHYRRSYNNSEMKGTFRVDAENLVLLRDGSLFRHMLYKLEGDTLWLCFDNDGGRRPQKFETREGTKLTILTLKRQGP